MRRTMVKRRVIQIALADCELIALADDGSLWRILLDGTDWTWFRVPALPSLQATIKDGES